MAQPTDDLDLPVLCFSDRTPPGVGYEEHYRGYTAHLSPADATPPGTRVMGLEEHLLALADLAKGFRCVVLGMHLAALVSSYCDSFTQDPLFTAPIKHDKLVLMGVWRGHPVYITTRLHRFEGLLGVTPDKPLARVRLVDTEDVPCGRGDDEC